MRRARFSDHEHPLGSWNRARRTPDPRLAGLLGRQLLGYQHRGTKFDSWLEPPRPELIQEDPARWSDVAYDAGYADQSHLNREFQQLAGISPTEFMSRLIPGGGVVGDGCAPAA